MEQEHYRHIAVRQALRSHSVGILADLLGEPSNDEKTDGQETLSDQGGGFTTISGGDVRAEECTEETEDIEYHILQTTESMSRQPLNAAAA